MTDSLNTPTRNTNKLKPYPLGNTDSKEPPYRRIGTPVETCLHKMVCPHDTIDSKFVLKNLRGGPGIPD